MRIYIVNIKDFNEQYPSDCSIDRLEQATEEEIIELNNVSPDLVCLAEPYTLTEFVDEFNYATLHPIKSDTHYIKIFED